MQTLKIEKDLGFCFCNFLEFFCVSQIKFSGAMQMDYILLDVIQWIDKTATSIQVCKTTSSLILIFFSFKMCLLSWKLKVRYHVSKSVTSS